MNGNIINNYKIRPPKVVGVVKNTQMVSPFGFTSEPMKYPLGKAVIVFRLCVILFVASQTL